MRIQGFLERYCQCGRGPAGTLPKKASDLPNRENRRLSYTFLFPESRCPYPASDSITLARDLKPDCIPASDYFLTTRRLKIPIPARAGKAEKARFYAGFVQWCTYSVRLLIRVSGVQIPDGSPQQYLTKPPGYVLSRVLLPWGLCCFQVLTDTLKGQLTFWVAWPRRSRYLFVHFLEKCSLWDI